MGVGTLDELQTALSAKLAIVQEGMQKGVKIDGNNVELSPETANAIKTAWSEAQEIKGYIDMANAVETKGVSMFGGMPPFTAEEKALYQAVAPGAYGGPRGEGASAPRSLSEAFTESDEFKSFIASGKATMDEAFQIKAADISSGSWEQKDIYSTIGSASTTRTLGPTQRDPLVPRAYRQTRVRDLFPVARTTAALIDYFKVLGYASGGAKSVAERMAANGTDPATGGSTDVFGKKPRTALQFTSAQAPVRTIAHWEAAHCNALNDVPQLRNIIDTELLYGLRLEEDRQILNGSGNNDELLGLLNTSGIQTYTGISSDRYSDALRKAATLCMLANFQATGYVLHPYDWEKIEIQKGSDGQYMLITNIAIGAGAVAWRQPVVETPAIDEGTFLTGAFGLGAQVYDREDANVRVSEHHEDFFVRNAIVVLVEERLALAVKRPESFVKGDFGAATV